MCRLLLDYLKENRDCKVVTGENVARQIQTVLCKMILVARKRRRRRRIRGSNSGS